VLLNGWNSAKRDKWVPTIYLGKIAAGLMGNFVPCLFSRFAICFLS